MANVCITLKNVMVNNRGEVLGIRIENPATDDGVYLNEIISKQVAGKMLANVEIRIVEVESTDVLNVAGVDERVISVDEECDF